MLKRALLCAMLALPLAGCVSFGAEPPDQLLTLTPARAVPAGFATTGPARAPRAGSDPGASTRCAATREP